MVVGSAQQLANCRKGGLSNDAARSDGKGGTQSFPSDTIATVETVATEEGNGSEGAAEAGDGEGVFLGLERVSAPGGSVIVWDGAQAPGGERWNRAYMARALCGAFGLVCCVCSWVAVFVIHNRVFVSTCTRDAL